MANVFDYLSWRGDLSFSQASFNPVDNIIFSQLSYLPLDNIVPTFNEKNGITIGRAAEIISERLESDPLLRKKIMFKDDIPFISALRNSPRFRDCELRDFINHVDISQEKQFSALTIAIGDGSSFIAFRGTDATLVGWKEDFNMCFRDTVPAQLEAVSYLERAAKETHGPLRLGGHSKGGNLAIYAASFCGGRASRRIEAVYSNDAPGFLWRVIESEGFARIRGRIRSFVPQSSIIGMLLEHVEDYAVVKSSQAGLMQHELYSWEVTHNDLVRVETVTQESRFVDKTLREWINGLDYEHREQFTEFLYTILSSTQAKSFPELTADWFKSAGRIIHSLNTIDESTRAFMGKTITALFRAARNNIDVLLPQGKSGIKKNSGQRHPIIKRKALP